MSELYLFWIAIVLLGLFFITAVGLMCIHEELRQINRSIKAGKPFP